MAVKHDVSTEQAPVSRKRRGLIAGAAALMVAAISKQGTESVAAANGASLIIGGDAGGSGVAQSGSATTWLATTALASGPAFRATNGFTGSPDATRDGSQGFTTGTNFAGVFGRNNDLNGVGTWGEAPSGTGAFGDSTSGSGVAGNSSTGAGVYGQSGSGYGGQFVSTSNIGVYAVSSGSYGILGVTTAGAPFSGITGGARVAGAAAFAGGGTNGAYGAYFTGPTVVEGNFTVVGGQKNAAVQHTDGTYRLLHCVESPEPWFEDYGSASFTNGVASIVIDPDFAAVVRTDNYLVFLTEVDGHNNLSVSNQTATSFEVHTESGIGNGQFAWRLIAKRKDIKVSRLAKFTLPNIKIPGINDDTPLPGKPTIPTPRPAQGGSAPQPVQVPVAPAPQPQPRAPQAAAQPAPAATGGTATNPLPPSR